MALLDGCKITYFSIPGRGEATRLALTIGSVKFTDERISFPQWKELKPNTSWGGMPILTLSDGSTVISQQRAILRLVGKETNLYPTDLIAAAKVDELMDALEDLGAKTFPIGAGLPQAEKEAARKEACEAGGVIHGMLEKIERFISENGSNGHTVGESFTVADLFMYTCGSALISGLFDGVPADVLDALPHIQACRKIVRSHPAVTKYYDELDGEIAEAYGPL
jgi:glutathione S-transferase